MQSYRIAQNRCLVRCTAVLEQIVLAATHAAATCAAALQYSQGHSSMIGVVRRGPVIFIRKLVSDFCSCDHVHVLWTQLLTASRSIEYQRAFCNCKSLCTTFVWLLHHRYCGQPNGALRPSPWLWNPIWENFVYLVKNHIRERQLDYLTTVYLTYFV